MGPWASKARRGAIVSGPEEHLHKSPASTVVLLRKLIARQEKGKPRPLSSKSSQRRKAAEARSDPGVSFLQNERDQLRRRLRDTIKSTSIPLLPDHPGNKQHQRVKAAPEALWDGRSRALPPIR